MTRFLSRLADRLRANATIRRKQYIKRWVEKRQQPEMRAGEWFGEPLDAHYVPLAGHRNPRGSDGRRV